MTDIVLLLTLVVLVGASPVALAQSAGRTVGRVTATDGGHRITGATVVILGSPGPHELPAAVRPVAAPHGRIRHDHVLRSPAWLPVPVVRMPATVDVPLRTLVEGRGLHIAIGTAVGRYFGRPDAAGVRYAQVLAREFNELTAENEMKFSSLRPSRAVFNFARPDSMVAFAKANNMKVRGHTLAFGNQLSSWLTNGTWTAAEVRALLDEHISGTVTHYRGQIAAWDVVNEALNENGTLKPTFWSNALGRAYIEQAFRSAAAADPAAALFYNDYNIETIGAKSDSVYEMLRDFKARGVPVHGVGFQAHFVVGRTPSRDALIANMTRFAALGLKIQFTELDLRLTLPATAGTLTTQATGYADVVLACLATPACDMIVMWGFTDLSSWIPATFPGMGAALLFDTGFLPKPAYSAVNDVLARF